MSVSESIRLLVIEDNGADFLLLRKHLGQEGLAVSCRQVASREDLAAALAEGAWEVALCDYHVPGLDLEESLALIRKAHPALPVILVAGSIGEERAVELLKEGISDFVLKDSLKRLAPAIRRALAEAAERRARQAAETALREREERLRTLGDNLPDGAIYQILAEAGGQRRFTYFSTGLRPILGLGQEEILADADALLARIHPEDRERLCRAEARAGERGEAYDLEVRLAAPEAPTRWLNLRAMPRDQGGGSILWDGLVLDISRRKRDEEALRRAALLFANIGDGAVVTDRQGNILAVNPAFTTITGYEEGEVAGRNMRLLQSGHHDHAFYQQMWQAIQEVGTWQGEIWDRRKNGDVYLERLSISAVHDDKGAVTNYVGILADITRLRHAHRMEHLAHHDALTGLPNRLQLMSRLNHALEIAKRNRSLGAVLFFDLDRFKPVNDALGHSAGDELLQLVARRLLERLRDVDTLARLGGDEFVVVVEDLAGPEGAGVVAGEIVSLLGQPFPLSCGQEAHIGGSVGIALFPCDGDTADKLLRQADRALYQAKEQGRGDFRYYDPETMDSGEE